MGAAVCVKTERQKLRDIAAQIRADIDKKSVICQRSREWVMVPIEHRMAVLMLAGVDGDLGQLARRAWPEFTDAEKMAVNVTMRAMFASLDAARALRVKAG